MCARARGRRARNTTTSRSTTTHLGHCALRQQHAARRLCGGDNPLNKHAIQQRDQAAEAGHGLERARAGERERWGEREGSCDERERSGWLGGGRLERERPRGGGGGFRLACEHVHEEGVRRAERAVRRRKEGGRRGGTRRGVPAARCGRASSHTATETKERALHADRRKRQRGPNKTHERG